MKLSPFYERFESWEAVLAFVKQNTKDNAARRNEPGARIFYQPPMNYQPVEVVAAVRPNGRTLIVYPWDPEADYFEANEDHFERFVRRKPPSER